MENNSQSKILVVDDVAINVMLLKRILEKADYDVYTAENGNDALDVMMKERINLVLLDVSMPKLDGFGVLDKKKEMKAIKNIPVIMVSAFNQSNIIQQSLEKGAKAYLTKPVDRRELMSQMDKILS